MKLIIFPELAATGYFLSPGIGELAEHQNGKIAQFMSETARTNETYIVYGYVERGDHGETYNSLRLIDRHGEMIANYRKIHITELEKGIFTPGNEVVSVQTELGHLGLMICWDLAFPELARLLALKGADMLVVPTAWERPYDEPYARFGTARAIDNTLYVAVCNHVGQSENLSFFGGSGLYGPDGGQVALEEKEEERVVIAEVDIEYRRNMLSHFYTMLNERRTDLYGYKGEVPKIVQSEENLIVCEMRRTGLPK